jgi:hypothetical protein
MELMMLFFTITATVLFQLALCFFGFYAKHAKA